MCLHSAVSINGKERTLRCRKCETLIDPFDYLMTLCDQESRYWESVSISDGRKSSAARTSKSSFRLRRTPSPAFAAPVISLHFLCGRTRGWTNDA
jgi:hypothetical protein